SASPASESSASRTLAPSGSVIVTEPDPARSRSTANSRTVTSTPLMLRILRRMATTPEQKPSIAPVVGPDAPRRFTDSGIEIKHAYDESDVRPDLDDRLGEPGDFPYTRGIHPDMY